MASQTTGSQDIDRRKVLDDLSQYVKGDMLMRHLLGVEAAMRAYARRFGEDEERWGIAGLVHDFDWEIVPSVEAHPQYGADILRSLGYPDDIVRAVLTHGDHPNGEHLNVKRETMMEHMVFACDELCGFIRAVTLVRPNKSLDEVTPRSVIRKMKDKAFARDVNRDDIVKGASEAGLDLEEHIAFIIDSLKPIAGRLGLYSEFDQS